MERVTDLVLDAIESKKAQDIRIYDMRTLSPFMETMIVCSTSNLRQNNAVAQAIRDVLKEADWQGPMHVEGRQDSKWILVDLGDVVVDVFVAEEREYYGLDKLYRDVLMEKVHV